MELTIQTKNLRTGLLQSSQVFSDVNSLESLGESLSEFINGVTKPCLVSVVNNDQEEYGSIEITFKNGKKECHQKKGNYPFKKNGIYPKKYLVQIDPKNNQNKFYQLEDDGENIKATFGRIGLQSGVTGRQDVTYSPLMYFVKIQEKLSNGYVDQSELVKDSKEVDLNEGKEQKDFKKHNDSDVEEFLRMLYACSAQVLDQEYTVQPVMVSNKMISEAEILLDQLYHIDDFETFNNGLIELFRLLPRRMRKVKDYLARETKDMTSILSREADLLDNMKLHMSLSHIEVADLGKTINETLGFGIEKGSVGDYAIVREKLGKTLKDRLLNVYRVVNYNTNKRYEEYQDEKHADTKLLWHGSKTENWLSIMSTGLSLSPNAVITGKMFGYGIYFAPSAMKSYNYTSGFGTYWANGNSSTAIMGLFEVAYGNPLEVYNFSNDYSRLDKESFRRRFPGFNCLHAKASDGMLRNDEIIFYDEAQINIRYLVELKA